MRIATVDLFELTIPFDDGGEGRGLPENRWRSFETVLLRVTAEDGGTGWGEAFSYGCRHAVVEALRHMVLPLLIGGDASDPAAIMLDLQRRLHIFGRYGIAMFALSGVDIALWDLKARREGVPLANLIGPVHRRSTPAYASLVRYGLPELVERTAAKAVAEGYRSVKLHEIDLAAIAAGRRGAGPSTHLTVDANCAWTLDQAIALVPELERIRLDWLEEPLFPPEDLPALRSLAAATRIPLAAGENACTRYEFDRMISSGALHHPQPSVTKVGGVTEAMAVLRGCEATGVTPMLHSPYYGPGYWATLQLIAVAPGEPLLECLYVQAEAHPGVGTPLPAGGRVQIPDGPGLGFAPDWAVFERYGRRIG